MNSLIKREETTKKIILDSTELEKQYVITANSKFEKYTGKNMELWFKNAWCPETKRDFTKQELANDILKKLGYEGRPTLDLTFGHYWEPSDSGFSDHDVLRYSVRKAVLFVDDIKIIKKEA